MDNRDILERMAKGEVFKDSFFMEKIKTEYPSLIGSKPEDKSWKIYYLETIKNVALLEEKLQNGITEDYTMSFKNSNLPDNIKEKIAETYTGGRKLYHLTTLDGLYKILQSGYLKSRGNTGVVPGFSPANNEQSGGWIYLSMNEKLPPPGRISVQLVFSPKLLLDRYDYFLNYKWSYGKTSDSLPPEQIQEFIKKQDYTSEIIFKNEIPLEDYLLHINVVQLPESIIQNIPKEYRPEIIDLTKVPQKYRNIVSILSK